MKYATSFRTKLIACLGGMLLAFWAAASDFPTRPIRLIVPVPPGGVTDTLARVVGKKLGDKLGQPVVVENRAGANTIIGTDALAKSRPDGHTLGIVATPLVVNPFVARNLPYEILRDLEPISLLTRTPGVLVVNPAVPASTVMELVDLVRLQPRQYFYAIPSALTNGHLTMELIKAEAGLRELQGVVYRGGAPATLDVVAGRAQMMILSPTATLSFIHAGKLRPIATTGSASPAILKNVPTLKDSGFPRLETYEWAGVMAPAGVPQAVLKKIQEGLLAAMKDPEVVKLLEDQGMETLASTPAEFRSFIAEKTSQMRQLARTVNLDVE